MKFVIGKKHIKSKFVKNPKRPIRCIGHRRSISTPKNSLGRVKAQSRALYWVPLNGLMKNMKTISEDKPKTKVLNRYLKSLRRSTNCRNKSHSKNPKIRINPVLILLANADTENRATAIKSLNPPFSRKYATETIVANSQMTETIYGGFDRVNAGRPKAKENRSM